MIRKNNFLFPFPPFHYSCVPLFLCSTIPMLYHFCGSLFSFPLVPQYDFPVPPFLCSSISLFLRSNFFPLCSTLCFLSLETFFHWHYFPYCSDKFFPALGFGAKIPPGMQVCKQHIFFVCLFVFSFIIFFPSWILMPQWGVSIKGKTELWVSLLCTFVYFFL